MNRVIMEKVADVTSGRSTRSSSSAVAFRLNYIYRPGDDLFIVYNDSRNRTDSPAEMDRSLVIKLTHSFDF